MRRWPPCSPRSSTLRPAPPRLRAGSPSATRSPPLLRGAEADEVEIAVAWLSGETRQGRIGVGWATLAALRGTAAAAAEPTLTLREADAALDAVARTSGKGSAAARSAALAALFARASAAEQDFLVRLLVGELRQGALEGVMLDAIAAAAGIPAAEVRRAAMVTGNLREVARVALADGDGARRRGPRALRRRPAPAGAADARDARRRHRRRDGQARHGGARMEGRRRARAGAQGGRHGHGLHPRAEGRDRVGARDRRGACRRCRPKS